MFYFFHCHIGDDNDNSIGDVIVDAATLEEAFSILQRQIPENYDIVEGDGETLYTLYLEGTGEIDSFGDEYYIPWHFDFYFQSEHGTLDDALECMSIWHWNYNPLILEDDDNAA